MSLDYRVNPDVKELFYVIVFSLADEYIQIAKENPDIFSIWRKFAMKEAIHANPTHLLAGMIRCKSCDGTIVQVNCKNGGYYGCYNAKKNVCKNTVLMPWKQIESLIINALKEKFLNSEILRHVCENVEKTIAVTLNEVPKALKQKRSQLEKVHAELQNYLISYYVTHTNIQTLALLDEESRDSNWVQCRTWKKI